MTTKLKDNFEGSSEVRGFMFNKVFENDKGYVYEVEHKGKSHFEAFYKKEVPLCIDFSKRIYSETEKKEVYPKSRDFGSWAWSAGSLDRGIELLK